jgi:hypothetical protein
MQASQVRAISNPESNDVRPEVVRRFMDVAAWAFHCQLNSGCTSTTSGAPTTRC